MTAQKHLRDLLSEDQEPFILQNYIADRRRCHINRWNPATAAAINNLKPGTIASFSGSNLCKSVCFSFPESPDLWRSPVPSLAPPCKTAALLLEAATRIQQKTDCGSAPIKRSLFGSILKRLTHRNRRLKPEMSVDRRQQQRPTKRASSIGCTGHSRQSSAWWSESNGERSLGGLEESTSGSDDDADVHRASSVSDGRQDWEFALMNGQLCKSPFRSSGHRSPVFSPPVTPSPFRHGKEETSDDDYELVESPKKVEGSDEQEEDKEQTSPVSVLDPAAPNFQDEEVVDDEDGYQDIDDARDRDYNCSYANVQRAKQQLLEKLCRFEKLAELDPAELEKIMLEQDSDDEEDEISVRQDEEMSVEEFTKEVIKSRFGHMRKIPSDMRNLVSDLISEEWVVICLEDRESLMKRVCGKIEWWKEVDSDMMVEEDFRRSEIICAGWNQIAQQQIGDIVLQIEVSIFDSLVTEFFHL